MESLRQNGTATPLLGTRAADWVANHIPTTITTILALLISTFIYRVNRFRNRELARYKGLPRLPGNKFFGTIPSMVSLFKNVPSDAHPHAYMTLLQREHKLDNIFFLDSWPASGFSQMIITDPALAAQVTQTHSLPKHSEVRRFVQHITGSTSLVFTEGAQWRAARSLFNPGFALSHLITLVPSIVDDTTIFCSILEHHASLGDVFQVEDAAAKLTIDIMAHVVLDHSLNSQTVENELVEAFRTAVEWSAGSTDINPFAPYNPAKWFAHWWYARKMDRILGGILDERYALKASEQARGYENGNGVELGGKGRGRKPAIDLALDEYAKQQTTIPPTISTPSNSPSNPNSKPTATVVNATFKKTAIDSMKSFIFAGHDTSSSTICFIYHCLSRHPQAAERLRAEHDEVFGLDSSVEAVGGRLKADPNSVNRLPYTLALIKETLRLYPPASTVRQGAEGVDIVYKGESYPTKDIMVWVVSHTIHRRADLFPTPDAFIPERFLPPTHALYFQPQGPSGIPKDAFRPFEKGPRNCIGQELAMLEMKIILCLTARLFDVRAAYEEWDAILGRKPLKGIFGDRAYQILKTSAKPVDGFPGVVTRRR